MTVYTGTATDYKDLLTKVRDHMVVYGWTVEKERTEAMATGDDREYLYMKGPDIIIGADTVNAFVNLHTENTTSIGNYNIAVNGAISFTDRADLDALDEFTDQAGSFTDTNAAPHLLLWNSTMPYWLIVNDRRIIVITKASTVYASCYAGFLLPFSTPSEYPYPIYISCNGGDRDHLFSRADYRVGSCANPPRYGAKIRSYDGTWVDCFNYNFSDTYSKASYATTLCTAHPYYDNSHINYQVTPSGEKAHHPVYLMGAKDGTFSYGEMEGIESVYGSDLSPEDDIDTNQYKIFPSTYRIAAPDFFTVRLN